MKPPRVSRCSGCNARIMWVETPIGDWTLLDVEPFTTTGGYGFVLVPDPIAGDPEAAPPIAMAVKKRRLENEYRKTKKGSDNDLLIDDGTRYTKHECGRSE